MGVVQVAKSSADGLEGYVGAAAVTDDVLELINIGTRVLLKEVVDEIEMNIG